MERKIKFATTLALYLLLPITLIRSASPDKQNKDINGSSRVGSFSQLGRKLRQDFFMEPNFTYMNHGSYGTYPKVVATAYQNYQKISEQSPDMWLRRNVYPALSNVRKLLADLLNILDPDDLVMIPNTTFGINSILRSFIFQAGERILHFSTIYNAVENTLKHVLNTSCFKDSISTLVFNVTYPISNEKLLKDFEAFLEMEEDPQRPIRLAIIDHFSALPSVLNPIHELISLLRKRNILVLIDGAHGIGHVGINMTQLKPDFYVTSCHKWLFVPRGCGVLYVDKQQQNWLHSAVINRGYQNPVEDFPREFEWIGTMDFSAYMTIPTALEYRRKLGGEEEIIKYNHNLAWEGGSLMASIFKTEVLQEKSQIGSMIDVRLPIWEEPKDPQVSTTKWWINIQLEKYPETFAMVFKHGGKWWARVCAQVYNDLEDFKTTAEHFLMIIKNEIK